LTEKIKHLRKNLSPSSATGSYECACTHSSDCEGFRDKADIAKKEMKPKRKSADYSDCGAGDAQCQDERELSASLNNGGVYLIVLFYFSRS